MADIRPFRGVLYNPRKVKDIDKVVTEPYDVISPAGQKLYYRRHPYNIVRLILGQHHPADNSRNNQYTRAHKFFADWQRQDVLLRDEKPSIYIYVQSFPHDNQRRTRTGFIVLLKLEDFAKNSVLPHENTFSSTVQDRLKLLKTCHANLSPIFALFCDPERKINKLLKRHRKTHRPYIVVRKGEVLHRIWRMSDKKKISAIRKLLKGRQIFIADGHHRYEAALNYKLQMQKRQKRANTFSLLNYVMTYLVATADPGLAILPTHRVVRIKTCFRPEEIVRKIRKDFKVRKFSTSAKTFSYLREALTASGVFGAYFGKNKFYGLKLKSPRGIGRFLDAAILHSVIIEQSLNFIPFEESIYYTRDAQEAIKLVDGGKYQIAFFLRPAKITQVKRVARAREKMPHKSTYFYPKLLTGLVINKLNEGKR